MKKLHIKYTFSQKKLWPNNHLLSVISNFVSLLFDFKSSKNKKRVNIAIPETR